MHDIDLIPQDYRNRLWQQSYLHGVFFVASASLALIAIVWIFLFKANSGLSESVRVQQDSQQEQSQILSRLSALEVREDSIRNELKTLNSLRSGAAADQILLTVDRALADFDVWFVSWKFQREGVLTETEMTTVNTGYFIVVPQGTKANPEELKLVRTSMSIRGKASDHNELSGFVQNLLAQPEIENARVQRTFVSPDRKENVVNFELDITLTTRAVQS